MYICLVHFSGDTFGILNDTNSFRHNAFSSENILLKNWHHVVSITLKEEANLRCWWWNNDARMSGTLNEEMNADIWEFLSTSVSIKKLAFMMDLWFIHTSLWELLAFGVLYLCLLFVWWMCYACLSVG